MHALAWLYDQHTRDDPAAWRRSDGGDARCYLCGAPCPACAPSQPTRTTIPDTFMEQEIVRCASSPWVCPACAAYFLSTGGQRLADLTSYSHIVTPTALRRWERDAEGGMRRDIEGWLAHEAGALPDGPMVIAVVTTALKRQHVLPRAEVTTSSSRLTIRLDQQTIWVTPAEWRAIITPFDALRATGHSKREIVSGALHPVALARDLAAGRLARVLALSEALEAWRGHPALDLVAFTSASEVTQEGEQEDVAPAGASATTDMMREGKATTYATGQHDDARTGGRRPARNLGRHQPGLQGQVPHGHLGTTPEPRGGAGAHDGRSADVHQQALWDV